MTKPSVYFHESFWSGNSSFLTKTQLAFSTSPKPQHYSAKFPSSEAVRGVPPSCHHGWRSWCSEIHPSPRLLTTGWSEARPFAVRRVHKQVAEVARAFGAFHRIAEVVHILLVLRGIGHVHDEACMAAVNVILPAEQRGGLVEQGWRNGRKITW